MNQVEPKVEIELSAYVSTDTMVQRVMLAFCWGGDKGMSINVLPPLGILGIASFLEVNGIEVDVIDFSVNPKASIEAENYDLIGFSVNISNRSVTRQVISDIRSRFPDKHLVAGGPLCISNPELMMETLEVDAVFACEGEEALLEYINSDNKDGVKGVYLRNGSSYRFNGARGWITDLDSLPFPAYHKIDVRKYRAVPKKNQPVTSITTSRGCPYSCIFCSHSMGRKWRFRSPENVVDEIEWQVNEFGVREICIYDDNFSLNRGRAEAICDLIIERKLPVTLQFSNGLRADNLDADLLKKMKQAGTWLLGLAPETGNPEVMKKIKKGFDHSQVLDIRKACKKLGISTFAFFMIGFPFETREDIEDTVRYAKELDCEMVEFNKVIPYAKTELFEMIVEGGNLLNDPIEGTQSYHQGGITTHKVGDLSPDEIRDLIRKAYQRFYLRPRKIVGLLRTFALRDIWRLATYALRTGNV